MLGGEGGREGGKNVIAKKDEGDCKEKAGGREEEKENKRKRNGRKAEGGTRSWSVVD